MHRPPYVIAHLNNGCIYQYNSFCEFYRREVPLENEPCSEQLSEIVVPKRITAVQNLIREHPQITYHLIKDRTYSTNVTRWDLKFPLLIRKSVIWRCVNLARDVPALLMLSLYVTICGSINRTINQIAIACLDIAEC
jgi:thioester reductase-like protein